jgi:DNA-binding CsgD family transcriptional regulator
MASAWATRERAQCNAIAAELSTVRLDGTTVFEAILPELRATLDVESLLLYTPAVHLNGWVLDRFHSTGMLGARCKDLLARFLTTAPRRFGTYDPIRPEASQRNRVINPFAKLIEREAFEASPYYSAVFRPQRIERHHQLRVLLCEGPSLLTWFGTLHPEAFEPRHYRILRALIPALLRRLIVERRMQASELDHLVLDVAIERIGGPAFVIGAGGRLLHANEAGHTLLAERGTEVRTALHAAIAGRPAELAFSVTPLTERGAPRAWLATLRASSAQAQLTQCVAAASRRWQLTPRQRSVLQQLVEGHANATIAALANTSERAVELHVTALLDRAGVDSRAALVSRVLLA